MTSEMGRETLRIAVIPSWFPSERQPYAGIFVQEQVEAIAAMRSTWDVFVSTLDYDSGFVSLRQAKSFSRLCVKRNSAVDFLTRPTGQDYTHAVNRGAFWNELLPGGIARMIHLHMDNIRAFEEMNGPIDIIHAHVGLPAGAVAVRIAERLGIPAVLTEHMAPFPFSSYLRLGRLVRPLKVAFERAKRVISVSERAAEGIRNFGLKVDKVIPNVVNEAQFSIGGTRHSRFRFISIASMEPRKGIVDLLYATSNLLRETDDFELVIIGGGPELERYRSIANDIGIGAIVQFLGPQSRSSITENLKLAHAFVLPSHYESFGVVYAEALMSGLPVIATACGGPEDFVGRESGIIVDVGDVPAIADAMRKVFSNQQGFSALKIRELAVDRFSRESVVKQLEAVYRECIED